METMGIFDRTVRITQEVLDLRSRKHDLIVSNIANIDTPDYKGFDLVIGEELAGVKKTGLFKTHKGHMTGRGENTGKVKSKIVANMQTSIKGDSNTVNVDKAMADMAENNILFNAMTKIISRKFHGLRNVIKGGK